MSDQIDGFCGLDVGKSSHYATALNRGNERLYDRPLPQDEARLRAVFTELHAHGRVMVIVDQPNTIGALPIAVARDTGCEDAHLPALAILKAVDLYPGKTKTDTRDAFIIADAARSMPHTLRAVDRDNEALCAENPGLIRCRPDPCMHQGHQPAPRAAAADPRGLGAVRPRNSMTRPLVFELFINCSDPADFRKAGKSNVLRFARNHSRKDPAGWRKFSPPWSSRARPRPAPRL